MWKYMIILLLLSLLLLSACAGDQRFKEGKKANFLHGIWHGWIAPVSLIFSIFSDKIRLYEPNNTGWTYDLGFYIAILGGFGAFALTRKKRHKDD